MDDGTSVGSHFDKFLDEEQCMKLCEMSWVDVVGGGKKGKTTKLLWEKKNKPDARINRLFSAFSINPWGCFYSCDDAGVDGDQIYIRRLD
jgi:hypothetical protein